MKHLFQTVLLAAGIAAAPAVALACADRDLAIQAVEAGDRDLGGALYDRIAVDPECDDAFRSWLGTAMARANAEYAMQTGLSADAKREALEASLGYQEHWRTQTELGRLDWDQKNYASAANRFQLAINLLIDGPTEHDATEQEIRELHRLATQAVALADTPVAPVTTRSGTIGGIFAPSIRGFIVEEVPMPITFVFAETNFDDPGQSAANQFRQAILEQNPNEITLVGHTDPVGSEEANMKLSLDRAIAVGKFLQDGDYGGKINVIGMGESQPPGDVPSSITPEEFDRLSRRVVWVRK